LQVMRVKISDGKVTAIEEIYSDDGLQLSCSSVAVPYGNGLLIGSMLTHAVYCSMGPNSTDNKTTGSPAGLGRPEDAAVIDENERRDRDEDLKIREEEKEPAEDEDFEQKDEDANMPTSNNDRKEDVNIEVEEDIDEDPELHDQLFSSLDHDAD